MKTYEELMKAYEERKKEYTKSWINEYGYDEGYIYRSIDKSLTGHLWRGSAMETDSSCGNCDGANCDGCRELWTVTHYGPPHKEVHPISGYEMWADTPLEKRYFYSEEEAQAFYDSLKEESGE